MGTRTGIIVCIIVAFGLIAITPVEAVTAERLDIRLDRGGNADITFEYSLSFFERIAVFLRIADPARELKSALENNFGRPVTVTALDSGRVNLVVDDFASVKADNSSLILTTPGLSFIEAERILRSYWFAPLINPDFSPSQTRVVFPDGFTQSYDNVLEIPPIIHRLAP